MGTDVAEGAELATIGGRIRWARKRAGLSQEAVARVLPPERPRTRASIALYETGSNFPSLETIGDLAHILGTDPGFLAFGQDARPEVLALRGQELAVVDGKSEARHAFLPHELLAELGGSGASLQLVRLAVSASFFGIQAHAYVLIDAADARLRSDGLLYAVNTSAGAALVRSEPALVPENGDELLITTGQGMSARVPAASLDVLGRVLASLRKED